MFTNQSVFRIIISVCSFLILSTLPSCNNKKNPCICNTDHIQKNDSILASLRKNNTFQQKRKDLFQIYPLENQLSESYRLFIEGALSYYTHTFLIQKNGNGANIIVKEFISPDIYHTSTKLHQTVIFEIDQKQWQKIKYSMKQNCFWTNSLLKKPSSCLDASSYILEAYDPRKENCANENYHIDAWGSCDKTNLWKIARIILEKVDFKKLNN